MSLKSIREEKGFWNRGGKTARESGGKTSGHPGTRQKTREGLAIDLDEPPARKRKEEK